ncbi:MAG TPA: FAD-binding protein [Myxococcaceae bacterium]|nr:FAD-binding protein [Myxococcaceae bacterium]
MALRHIGNTNIISYGPGTWVNRHQNVVQAYSKRFDVNNPPYTGGNQLPYLRQTATALQSLIRDAIDRKVQLRAYGGTWSLSSAPVTNGHLVNTRPLNWMSRVTAAEAEPSYTGNIRQLVLMQCGVSIQQANDTLAQQLNLALKTSGASNGQTMVGAVSTGTHGSAFGFGAMQDYVVGMHVITGPNSSVWLERGSYPVLNAQFAQRLGAELKRDDNLFNAALVAFGSFGVVHAILVETEPLYLLNASRWREPYLPPGSPLRTAMTTLDFSGLPMPRPGETPYHFEVIANPHDMANGAYVGVMYKQPYTPNYTPPGPPTFVGASPGEDLLGVIGQLTNLLSPGLVTYLVNRLLGSNLPLYSNQLGTPGQMFNTTTVSGKAMSMELGVPPEHSTQILDFVLASKEAESFAGVLGIRYVKSSAATMAFTRFSPVTCTMEFQAAYSDTSTALYNFIWAELQRRNIPYTLHWGQMNNFTPQLVRSMYGSAMDSWISSRAALMDPQSRTVFNSPFLRTTGLAT